MAAITALLLLPSGLTLAATFQTFLELEALHDAKVITQKQQDGVEKIYPQGSVSRISGRMRYGQEVLVRGSVDVLTVQLAEPHEALAAFDASRALLQGQQANMLYWCAARECGPSNLWANQVFANARLYGPDDRQAYALFQLADEQSPSLMAVYAITRGNGRSFLHLEHFQAAQLPAELLPTPATLERQLRIDNRLYLARLTGMPDPVWVKLLVRALNQNSTMRVSMAGEHRQAWLDAMVEQGLRASRVELETDNRQPGLLLQRLP